MNELKDAAKAYYNNATEEQRTLAMEFFRALDIDGNGLVSLEEFTKLLGDDLALVPPQVFREFDQNGDGQLDFWEVLTIYYLSKTAVVSCDTCRRTLPALYFTCVTCFESTCGDTYDLCVGCYTKKAYSHEHRIFLDNHVLLRSKRNQNQYSRNVPKDTTPEEDSNTLEWSDAWRALEVGMTVGTVATVCSIM